jgi:hypothetical protein
MVTEKCDTCGHTIHPGCNFNQGRCPHRRPMIDDILLDNYKARYYNLVKSIQQWFKR